MAFNFGQVSEFTDSNSILNPVIAGLGKAVSLPRFKGALYQAMRTPDAPIKTKQFDIYSRSFNSRASVIGTATASDWGGTSATTALPMTAASVVGLTIGTVIKVDSEVVVVKSVNRSANTIDVFARGAGGTTAATHATSAAFSIVGYAGRDVDLKSVESVSEATLKYSNYVQTVFELLDYTKGAQLMRQGLAEDTVIPILRAEAATRLAANLATMAVNGFKQLGIASAPYMSAGMISQLEDTAGSTRPVQRYNASSTALSETILRGACDQVFLTGSPDTIVCNLYNANKFLTFTGAGKDVTIVTQRNDMGAGRYIDHYDYNGVRLDILIDGDMPNDKMAIVTKNDLQVGWMADDALTNVVEPTLSSREKRESLQGSVGFIVENVGYNHLEIYGLA